MAALNTQSLYSALTNPARELSAKELARQFSFKAIEVRLKGLGALASSPGLLNKIRGAMGQVMLDGASDAVRQQKPCDWSPCCASEVFFAPKPEVKIGFAQQEPQLVKPFVLSADRHGRQDLLIRMSVFGMAQEWAPMASQALASALRDKVNWRLISNGHFFVPSRTEIASTHIKDKQIVVDDTIPDECNLSFLTPVDTERTNIADHPDRLLQKLITRSALMSRWYGARLYGDLNELFEQSQNLKLAFEGPVFVDHIRIDSSRTDQHGFHDVSSLELHISGDLEPIWPLLRIGEAIHVGRGAVKGYGRYHLQPSLS